MTTDCDLLIVGGGPAGLAAAINGASEGLRVCVIDAGLSLGGQAKESNSIENYPLPIASFNGVTGADLMAGFVAQARKFDTDMYCPVSAARLSLDGDTKLITTDDYQQFASKTVLLANGLSYRRHEAKGIGPLMGRGVWYGMPSVVPNGKTIAVVGGANSAGQAVLRLAANPKNSVKLIVRKSIGAQMSQYLIDRIRAARNIELIEHAEVVETEGSARLEVIHLSTRRGIRVDTLCIFIGAVPRTMWLGDVVNLDPKRFIATDAAGLPFETNVPGVFAAGDVRSGSTKRIAAAIGEGVGALQMIHRHLAR